MYSGQLKDLSSTEKFEFSRVSPDQLDLKALEYLERGAKNFGGMVHVQNMLRNYNPAKDILVIGKERNNIACAIYLTITYQETGKNLTSVLLGGDGLDQWADELRDFYYKLAAEHDCDQFCLMGRKGFKRYFPELEEVATVFRVILKGSSAPIK